MSLNHGPKMRTIRGMVIVAIFVSCTLGATTSLGLTGSHQVVVAYYPGLPRWYTPAGCLWIGDPVQQYPLLGLYDNRNDVNVNVFDLACMKNMGATVANPHFFTSTVDTDRCDHLDFAAGAVGIKWTPTFEEFGGDPVGMANITNAFLALYGSSPNLMRVNNRPVMFWRLSGAESDIADAVDLVRARSGEVMIILHTSCSLQPCQPWPFSDVSQLLKDPDTITGYPRVNGLYYWVPVFWCEYPSSTRQSYIDTYVSRCINSNMIPVLCTSPSYNEENWGYELGDECGVFDRTGWPHYNTTRDVAEWESNLNDLLYNNHPDAWIYIQAWDEWAEGSALAPNTYNCYDFLAKFKQVLYDKGWLTDNSEYCRPEYPPGYEPSECASTPVCVPVPLAPTIYEVSPDPDQITVGNEYTKRLYLSNVAYPAPTWSVVSGPSGLQVSSDGHVYGWTPSSEQADTFQTITIRAANTEGYADESWQVRVNHVPDQPIASFPFNSDAQGWTLEAWKAGGHEDGTVIWDNASGNPGGNIKFAGTGLSNNDDSCTREGGMMTRVISTAQYTNILIEYDVIATLSTPAPSGCQGNCGDKILEGSCEDKLVVYYSRYGTDGPWIPVQQLCEGVDLPTTWTHKTLSLGNLTAVENNANFAIRFTWQFNTTGDSGRIDNIVIKGNGDPPDQATGPHPTDGATGVSTVVKLSWSAGSRATSHKIYLGTSNPPPYCTTVVSATYNPGTLSNHTLYYWRIDEANADGVTTGQPWSFTTWLAPGDFDNDGDVDITDFGHLQACYSGSAAPTTGCIDADLDGDNDVDQADFALFKNCLGGADRPPGC